MYTSTTIINNRRKMVEAMKVIADTITDQTVFNHWNAYSDFLTEYSDDDAFATLMTAFLLSMKEAYYYGGLRIFGDYIGSGYYGKDVDYDENK